MPTQKLREFLSQRDSPIITADVNPKTVKSARSERWPRVSRWSEWADFSMNNVNSIIGWLLDDEFDLPGAIYETPPALLLLANEPVFEFELIRHNSAIVNAALAAIARRYPNLVTTCWTSGWASTTGDTTGYPDWSTIPLHPRAASDPLPDCVCPGDTKFNRKHHEFPLNADRVDDEKRWESTCLRQVCHYAKKRNTRYFYLLLPEGAIVGRRATSSRRDTVVPEIQKVVWNASEDELNINTALVFLFIISSIDHSVKDDYPDLLAEYKETVLGKR